ncbi:MAG: G-Protein alpha subunit [Candelina submexicana]|nr:MAG: G-Protein alpha subunit [Candelina submexicana]
MCFGKSKNQLGGDELAKSQEIDKMIRNDQRKLSKEIKLLLLGMYIHTQDTEHLPDPQILAQYRAGESGKSTVLKQMKLLYAEGFPASEREEWRATIFSNLINAFKVILDAMEEYGIEFGNPANAEYAGIILAEPEIGPKQVFPLECLPAFKALWNDAGIAKAIERGNEYALHDNLTYFFEDIDRLFTKDYLPNDQDVLRSRLRTTGITETIFELGTLTYRMFDVGGQRSERKKWIHCFESVNCLLFLVAISGYDQCLVEDKDANQMQEALMLFESIANSQWFSKSAIILFLNKIDLFKQKIAYSPITKYFPDYKDDPTDWKQASRYFADKFKGLNRNPQKEIYPHFTNATDTNLLKITMSSVQDMVIQRNLHTLIL